MVKKTILKRSRSIWTQKCQKKREVMNYMILKDIFRKVYYFSEN